MVKAKKSCFATWDQARILGGVSKKTFDTKMFFGRLIKRHPFGKLINRHPSMLLATTQIITGVGARALFTDFEGDKIIWEGGSYS